MLQKLNRKITDLKNNYKKNLNKHLNLKLITKIKQILYQLIKGCIIRNNSNLKITRIFNLKFIKKAKILQEIYPLNNYSIKMH